VRSNQTAGKTWAAMALGIAGYVVAAPGIGHASEELAKKNACIACHAVADRGLGPPLRDIAKRYAGQEDAARQLAVTIRAGSEKPKWGGIAMPPNPNVTPEDALTLAKWVLATK
jgi:cytochrome c